MRKCLPCRWVKLIAVMVLIVVCIAAGTGTAFVVARESVNYTVDFEYSMDEDSIANQFSIPGGGYVSFTDLVEVLGIAGDTNDDAEVSEATREFVENVASVEFSDPSLVDVSKVENETTVGQIKESRELECEYSAELTEEQIVEINEQLVEAGDWALIGMQPFNSEETLTVIMNDGEMFTIRVTDTAYHGTILPATELDGKIAALINTNRNNAVQSSAHSAGGRLQAAGVTIDSATGTITTTDPSVQLTEWQFTRVGDSGNNYYIHSSAGYLHIDASNGSVYVSDQPQSLRVDANNNNMIRIRSGNYALNNWSSQTSNGYGSWNGGGETGNNDEWFTLYEIEQTFPVTLHFVSKNGSEFPEFAAGDVLYADGTPVEIVNGNFKIDPDKLVIGADGIIDLNQFKINGYTLANTHKSTPQDINNSTDTYTHSIIGNELKLDNGTVQYRLFYTNHDKAGSWWFDAGMEPVRDNQHWQYNNGADPTNYSTETDNDEHPFDYYLVYDPIPTSSGSSSGPSPSGEPIDDIEKSKLLNPNGDGTYTMDLSVTTHARPHETSNGVNVIVVFDTSSSMTRSVTNPNNKYPDTYRTEPDSRFYNARQAINKFLTDLLPNNNASTNLVQLALIDFNYSATTHTFSGGTGNPAYWTNNASTFMSTVDSLTCPQGTNWAQALDKARAVAATADEDPTYILLMTDGAPSQYWDPNSKSSYFVSGEGCYLGARDEARAVVNAGYELYGVFSFGDSQDESNGYLDKLVDYAYNKEVHDDHSYYATNPEKLEQALKKIFGVLKERVAHTAVNYHDGIALDTTSTALSANVGGNLGSITYSKTGGVGGDYSVTADSGGNPTFIINGSSYAGSTGSITYSKITGSGDNITSENATATVYKCTVGSGDNAKTYYMPIATLQTNTTTQVGDLNWDLSPLGLLEDGATYKISFVVWPNQEAYDYVAKLNNGLMEWNESTDEEVYDKNNTLLYYKNGVANYPNIVRYPDGTFAVLTNTVQEVTYYIGTEDKFNESQTTTYTGQYTTNPVAPDPMPLKASASQIEKVWNIDRDPDILAQLLYGDPNNHYTVGFDIIQDNSTSPYISLGLGWDSSKEEYVWNTDPENIIYVKWDSSKNKYVRCEADDPDRKPIGTHWTKDFSIATGLMLSEASMDARKLDKNAYTHTTYNGATYYILEEGHDYTISEPDVGYEFDFTAPVYHPMLVDNVLKNVDIENVQRDSNGKIISYNITKMSPISVAQDGHSALTVVNTLRGYLNLEKVVLDNAGNPDTSDDTEFEFTITVENPHGVFEGTDIPWFAVNDCFYHTEDEDGEWHYYQVDKVSGTNDKWRVITEEGSSGPTYTFTSSTFDKDYAGEQEIECTSIDGTSDTITLKIYGNQTTPEPANSKTKIKVNRSIRQDQKLTIGNIPAGSTYVVQESEKYGYQLKTNSGNTTGTIVTNRERDVIFTNQKISTDVDILKKNETGAGLTGAIFELRTVKTNEGSEVEELASVAIGGISNFTKEIDGVNTEFTSAFETTGTTYHLTNLLEGKYRLYEVHVPDGYINTLPFIEFTVASGTVVCPTAASEINVDFDGTGTISLIEITNTPGPTLPHTGGPGTRLIYLFGMMLTVIAGAVLVIRKRMELD